MNADGVLLDLLNAQGLPHAAKSLGQIVHNKTQDGCNRANHNTIGTVISAHAEQAFPEDEHPCNEQDDRCNHVTTHSRKGGPQFDGLALVSIHRLAGLLRDLFAQFHDFDDIDNYTQQTDNAQRVEKETVDETCVAQII